MEILMNVKECIEKRFSCRKYADIPIPIEIINDILSVATLAPSPKNRQPWRFLVLQGESKKKIIDNCFCALSKNSDAADYLMKQEVETENQTFKILKQAPVLILVFNAFSSELVLNNYNASFDYLNMQAIGAAIQNMLLRATELGLGSLWVADILRAEKLILEQFPNQGRLAAGVALGVCDGNDINTPKRIPASKLITYMGG